MTAKRKQAFAGLKPEHVAAIAAIAADAGAHITKRVVKLTVAELGRRAAEGEEVTDDVVKAAVRETLLAMGAEPGAGR